MARQCWPSTPQQEGVLCYMAESTLKLRKGHSPLAVNRDLRYLNQAYEGDCAAGSRLRDSRDMSPLPSPVS